MGLGAWGGAARELQKVSVRMARQLWGRVWAASGRGREGNAEELGGEGVRAPVCVRKTLVLS